MGTPFGGNSAGSWKIYPYSSSGRSAVFASCAGIGWFKIEILGFRSASFIENLVARLSNPFDADIFSVLFMTINDEKKIGNEACKDLDHEPVSASRDKMIHFEMSFPLGEEFFNIPAELVYQRNLFRGHIKTVCSNPIIVAVHSVGDQPPRHFGLIDTLLPEEDFGIGENNGLSRYRIAFHSMERTASIREPSMATSCQSSGCLAARVYGPLSAIPERRRETVQDLFHSWPQRKSSWQYLFPERYFLWQRHSLSEVG